MAVEPFRDVVEIEQHLIADPNYRHFLLLRPKLYRPNMQSHIFGKGSQSYKSLSRNFDNVFLIHYYVLFCLLLRYRPISVAYQYLRMCENICQVSMGEAGQELFNIGTERIGVQPGGLRNWVIWIEAA